MALLYIACVNPAADVSTPTQEETTHESKVKRQFFFVFFFSMRRADSEDLCHWVVSVRKKTNNSFIVCTNNVKLVAFNDHEVSKCQEMMCSVSKFSVCLSLMLEDFLIAVILTDIAVAIFALLEGIIFFLHHYSHSHWKTYYSNNGVILVFVRMVCWHFTISPNIVPAAIWTFKSALLWIKTI